MQNFFMKKLEILKINELLHNIILINSTKKSDLKITFFYLIPFSSKNASTLTSLHIKSLNISEAFLIEPAHKIFSSKFLAVFLSKTQFFLNSAQISSTIISAHL